MVSTAHLMTSATSENKPSSLLTHRGGLKWTEAMKTCNKPSRNTKCHSERSEESLFLRGQTLRFTQGDSAGFTLVEILVVVAVIVILATMIVGITSRINNQAKEQLTENTFAIIDAALQEFCDYGWNYNVYTDFKFPLDVTEPAVPPVPTDILQIILGAEYTAKVTIEPLIPTMPKVDHIPEYASSELLYFFLSKVPECRATLDKIDESLITNKDFSGNEMKLVINDGVKRIEYRLPRFVDPWHQSGAPAKIGQTLQYDYSYEYQPPAGPTTVIKRSFPIITSAGPDGIFNSPGPDGKFGTADDVISSDDISSR
jgi:prepilin-type N-terminal cleavage/methylation domain-containing protein